MVLGFAAFVCMTSAISWRPNYCRLVSRLQSFRSDLIINGSRPRSTTTLDYYAHAAPSGDAHAADVMRSIINKARGAA